ncbi:MAG: hypothetical protein HYX22_01405 [Candidatus Yanofskybacteria bacterium]|nr:hypothetical protein [Candidatus Yanofskybacteria bacterium]
MRKYINHFWNWYEENLRINIGIAAGLFVWQLIHLSWLTTDIVFERLFSSSLLNISGFWEYAIIAVDYTEIPALITVSLIYINELRQGRDTNKSILFLALLNSQWLHLFWITDEFVIAHFRGEHSNFPLWLAWVAIMIDYLELPVMYDTIKKFFKTSLT